MTDVSPFPVGKCSFCGQQSSLQPLAGVVGSGIGLSEELACPPCIGSRPQDRGPWFLTSTGRRFFPWVPLPEDVYIEDVAHALSQICRFGGHCKFVYTVAQHSWLVSKLVAPKHALLGLLHDAAEAYIGDVVRPIKLGLPDYKNLERRVERAVWMHFFPGQKLLGLTDLGAWRSAMRDVKCADLVALATERRDVMPDSQWPWEIDEASVQPWAERLRPITSDETYALFMERFYELRGGRT